MVPHSHKHASRGARSKEPRRLRGAWRGRRDQAPGVMAHMYGQPRIPRQMAWNAIEQLDHDWFNMNDQQLDQALLVLSGSNPWCEGPLIPKLNDAQKQWLQRRFDNWNRGVQDHRLETMQDPRCTAAAEKQVKASMGFAIGATSQIVGQEWGRMKRRVTGQPLNSQKTPEQLDALEEAYAAQPYPDQQEKDEIAANTGLSRQQVNAWFQYTREQRGMVAMNNAEYIGQPPTWVEAQRQQMAAADQAVAIANQQRDASQAQLALRRTQELSVHGERVEMWPAGGTHPWLVPGAVLDTGNSARTMVSQTTAAHVGLIPDPGVPVTIRGVNGVESYPTARASVRIRGVTQNVRVAIGGTTPLLIGLDIIETLFENGFVLSRAAAEARAAAAAQQAAMGA